MSAPKPRSRPTPAPRKATGRPLSGVVKQASRPVRPRLAAAAALTELCEDEESEEAGEVGGAGEVVVEEEEGEEEDDPYETLEPVPVAVKPARLAASAPRRPSPLGLSSAAPPPRPTKAKPPRPNSGIPRPISPKTKRKPALAKKDLGGLAEESTSDEAPPPRPTKPKPRPVSGVVKTTRLPSPIAARSARLSAVGEEGGEEDEEGGEGGDAGQAPPRPPPPGKKPRPVSGVLKPARPAPPPSGRKPILSMVGEEEADEEGGDGEEKEKEKRDAAVPGAPTTTRAAASGGPPPRPPPKARPQSSASSAPSEAQTTGDTGAGGSDDEYVEADESGAMRLVRPPSTAMDAGVEPVRKPKPQRPPPVKKASSLDEPARAKSVSKPSKRRASLGGDSMRTLEAGLSMRRVQKKESDGQSLFWGDGLYDLAEEIDEEVSDFRKRGCRMRAEVPHTHESNIGYLLSRATDSAVAVVSDTCPLAVFVSSAVMPGVEAPILLDYDFNKSVYELIDAVLDQIAQLGKEITDSTAAFILKLRGRAEYLATDINTLLGQYTAVLHAYKFQRKTKRARASVGGRKDLYSDRVQLVLMRADAIERPFLRTADDDTHETNPDNKFVSVTDNTVTRVSAQGLSVLLSTLNKESEALLAAESEKAGPQRVIQAIKAICFTLCCVETPQLREAIQRLHQGSFSTGLAQAKQAVDGMVGLYEQATKQKITPDSARASAASRSSAGPQRDATPISELDGSFKISVVSLHRIPPTWLTKYKVYRMQVGLYLGGTLLAPLTTTPASSKTGSGWFPSIVWDNDWHLTSVKLKHLPRETRICFVLQGAQDDKGESKWYTKGWVSQRLFSHHNLMRSGDFLLGLWRSDKADPIGTCASNIADDTAPLVLMSLEERRFPVIYSLESSEAEPNQESLGASVWHATKPMDLADTLVSLKTASVASSEGEAGGGAADTAAAAVASSPSPSGDSTDAAPSEAEPEESPARTSLVPDKHVEGKTEELCQVHVALFAFTARDDDEMSLTPGDEIRVLEVSDDGWWHGQVDDRVGWFPANHADPVGRPAPMPRASVPTTISIEEHAPDNKAHDYVAIYAYEAKFADELSVQVGDKVHVLAQPEGGWWEAQLHDEVGWVPSNHIEVLPKEPEIGERSELSLKPASVVELASERRQDVYLAKYFYAAKNTDELNMKPGDEITISQSPDGGWWEGTHDGVTGWFPSNHVEKIERPSVRPRSRMSIRMKKAPKPAKLPAFVATHAFSARFEDELGFEAGEKVRLLQQPSGGWWQGAVGAKTGWFPSNHVVPIPETAPVLRQRSSVSLEHSVSDSGVLFKCVAQFEFAPSNTDELRFAPGDVIQVITKPDTGGWWEGTLGEQTGWFPCSHVKELPAADRGKLAAVGAEGAFPTQMSRDISQLINRQATDLLTASEKKLLWFVRKQCTSDPLALPKVLASMPALRSNKVVRDAIDMMNAWERPSPIQALELLHAHFADIDVRAKAVSWVFELSHEDVLTFLPQLVQALKYEAYHNSALAISLMKRALTDARLCQRLFWLLKADLENVQFAKRFEVMLETLLSTCGESMRREFAYQAELVTCLCQISAAVKKVAASERKAYLRTQLLELDLPPRFRLPLDPSFEVSGIRTTKCNVFSSNAAPLKLAFANSEEDAKDIQVIFKSGDDLRQDALVIQLIRIMDQMWLAAGVDLQMLTFHCTPVDHENGFIEMVSDAETLREIQTQYGVTGSFNDRILCEWLRRANPTAEQWAQARENFSASCAGFCVATYILGIGDRHNDNIMVTRDGHLFHIDFGHFLGNAQKFGNIKRDRVPFVLTSDMAYVINGGEKNTPKFQEFVDRCCTAFNILRNNARLLVNLLGLLLSSGMPELKKPEDISYMTQALMLDLTDQEAATKFTKMINGSLTARSTKINFFIHNLAQLKSGGSGSSTPLSFAREAGSVQTDSKIRAASVVAFEKRYDHEQTKYYVYVIEVKREDGTTSLIFRRFSEFNELHQKVLSANTKLELPSFPGKIYMGRSHTRQVSQKRMKALDAYIRELVEKPAPISQSDLVYTFLHSMPRDDHDAYVRAHAEGAPGGDDMDSQVFDEEGAA